MSDLGFGWYAVDRREVGGECILVAVSEQLCECDIVGSSSGDEDLAVVEAEYRESEILISTERYGGSSGTVEGGIESSVVVDSGDGEIPVLSVVAASCE